MKKSDIICISLGFAMLMVNGIEAACLVGISHCYTQSLLAEKNIRAESVARAAMQSLKRNKQKSRND